MQRYSFRFGLELLRRRCSIALVDERMLSLTEPFARFLLAPSPCSKEVETARAQPQAAGERASGHSRREEEVKARCSALEKDLARYMNGV